MQQVQRAANAPADPSGQDMRVAAKAAAMASKARAQLSQDDEDEHPAAVAKGTPIFEQTKQEEEQSDPNKNGVASILAAVKEYEVQGLMPAA